MRFTFTITYIFLYSTLFGAFSVGSEIYYECLGEGALENSYTYRIYQEYYIPCELPFMSWSAGSAVVFSGTTYYSNSNTFPAIELDSTIILETPEYLCSIIEPEYCVRKLYRSYEIDLPISNISYFPVFQHCCRTSQAIDSQISEFTNIINSEQLGLSNYIEITPHAQSLCNSSPRNLKNFPTSFCLDIPFEIDVSGEDLEGDQLVYEFYTPFDWTLNINNNIFPYDPPPYPLVEYKSSNYTYKQPLGLSANIKLDPNTGIITGTPSETGHFVVGVLIKEYRNGVLLSSTRRDFRLSVYDCIPKVEASIIADTINNEGCSVIDVCNDSTYTIENISTFSEYIDSYKWSFTGLEFESTTEWNPILNFSTGGIYEGMLILNENTICTDTTNILMNVTKEINADFSLDYDTCIAGEVFFENNSSIDGGMIENITWNLGDNTILEEQSPNHLYNSPGTYLVELFIENQFGCQDSIIKTIEWLPAPPIIVVAPSTKEGCSPLEVAFDNLSSPIDSTYDIVWNLGDSTISNDIHPIHTYFDTKTYSIEVSITSPIGCQIDTVFQDLIFVEPPVNADFSYAPNQITNLDPIVQFEDLSTDAVSWIWNFDEEPFAYIDSPIYEFQDTGFQQITLIAKDKYGCIDSLTKFIEVIPEVTYYLPNAFTPNGDGENDEFKGVGVLDGIKEFQMIVWDRWGGKVFETSDPNKGWNGQHFKTNKLLPSGNYICVVSYLTSRGKSVSIKEQVFLLN